MRIQSEPPTYLLAQPSNEPLIPPVASDVFSEGRFRGEGQWWSRAREIQRVWRRPRAWGGAGPLQGVELEQERHAEALLPCQESEGCSSRHLFQIWATLYTHFNSSGPLRYLLYLCHAAERGRNLEVWFFFHSFTVLFAAGKCLSAFSASDLSSSITQVYWATPTLGDRIIVAFLQNQFIRQELIAWNWTLWE